MNNNIIDIHHHIVPPKTFTFLSNRNKHLIWNPEVSLEMMERNGIKTSITSVPMAKYNLKDKENILFFTRYCNEYAAEMKIKYPGRFGSFAVLPMPFIEKSCSEAIYALDELKCEGITLSGNAGGIFLGDKSLISLMHELNKRNATVFVQAGLHSTSQKFKLQHPEFIVEYACDITRGALNLILRGTMEDFPNIRWILADGGGFLPYVAWRISLANVMPEFNKYVKQGVLTYLKRFRITTSMSAAPESLLFKELFDPSMILFGTGFMQTELKYHYWQSQLIENSSLISKKIMSGIFRANALNLFPQYKEEGEMIKLINEFIPETVSKRFIRLILHQMFK